MPVLHPREQRQRFAQVARIEARAQRLNSSRVRRAAARILPNPRTPRARRACCARSRRQGFRAPRDRRFDPLRHAGRIRAACAGRRRRLRARCCATRRRGRARRRISDAPENAGSSDASVNARPMESTRNGMSSFTISMIARPDDANPVSITPVLMFGCRARIQGLWIPGSRQEARPGMTALFSARRSGPGW